MSKKKRLANARGPSADSGLAQKIESQFSLAKLNKKKAKADKPNTGKLLEAIQSLYTTDGKDETKIPTSFDRADEGIDVQVLDPQNPTQGIPRPPKATPCGTYYETGPRDFAYAPVLPSDSTAKVSAAPDPKPDTRAIARKQRGRQLDQATAELKELAKSYIETLDTDEAAKVLSWIGELQTWKRREVYVPE